MNENYIVSIQHKNIPHTKYNKAIVSVQPQDVTPQEQKEVHTPSTEDFLKGFALTMNHQKSRMRRKRKRSPVRSNIKKKKASKPKKQTSSTKKKTVPRKNIF